MSTAPVTADSNLAFARRSDLMLSVAFLAVLIVLLVPLPTPLLDMLLALNLGMTVLLLVITLSAKEPLDVAVFPSLLLLLTLFRLALNIATTRLILLNGDGGQIVATFGKFVVGGNLVVGLVVFLILILIQFVVITKGASRISEVNARFFLDALPGRQMAIDGELHAGTIDHEESRRRRLRLTREAEFHAAMDGAGKYVRGDAVAGLLITAINLLGGVTLGLVKGLPIASAFRQYSVLTVGDGLVSQIPALLIATTAGILVTKTASDTSLGQEIGSQLLTNRRPLWIGAGIMSVVALTPGLPKIPFFLLSAGLILFLRRKPAPSAARPAADPALDPQLKKAREEEHLHEFLQTDRLCLEIGAQLFPLVESKRAINLPDRLAGLRRDLTRRHGLWIPTIRIRDNLQLEPQTYRILISGREVARGELRVDHYLAINPGKATLTVEGESTTDPAFGMPAKWISAGDRRRAELGGYTVVDAPSVLITHFGEVLQRHAEELLSREDLRRMLDKVKETTPALVDELKPELIRMGTLHQVLIHLLSEGVSIANLPLILESVVQHAPQLKDPVLLTERVRGDLGRTICDRFRDEQRRLPVIVLEPRLEMALRESVQDNRLALQAAQLENLTGLLSTECRKAAVQGRSVALLSDSSIRRLLREAVRRILPSLPVIAYSEIPNDLLIEPVAMLRRADVFGGQGDAVAPAAKEQATTEATDRTVWQRAA
jgi:flagellar biosynthesis protein FlhA